MARLAPSLSRFWAEVNKRWPFRDHWSDGWLGDDSHATRFSDHNPDASGWVHAVDTDATAAHVMGSGAIGDTICANLLRLARSGRPHPIHYIIYKGVIYSSSVGFRARAYTGSNSHHSHVHLSINRTDWARNWSGSWGIIDNRKPVSMDRIHKAWNKPRLMVSPIHVGRVQNRLKAKGLLTGRFVKGRFGRKTRDALKKYQQRHDFDSPVGRKCITALCGTVYKVVD